MVGCVCLLLLRIVMIWQYKLAIKKATEFVNKFQLDAAYRLAQVNEKLEYLERKLDFVENELKNANPSKRNVPPVPFAVKTNHSCHCFFILTHPRLCVSLCFWHFCVVSSIFEKFVHAIFFCFFVFFLHTRKKMRRVAQFCNTTVFATEKLKHRNFRLWLKNTKKYKHTHTHTHTQILMFRNQCLI